MEIEQDELNCTKDNLTQAEEQPCHCFPDGQEKIK